MEDINQSNVLVTSGQNGIIGPVRVRIISDVPYLCLPPSTMGVNGDAEAASKLVAEGESEGYSANSSYSEGDRSSLDGDIAKLVDDIEVKVQNISDSVENSRNETKILTAKYNQTLREMKEMAAIMDLQFKTLLSVKSLKELNGMQTSLCEQELNYSANQGAYESVNKDISDLITLSLEITRNETGVTTQAGLAPNVAETESELDQVTTLEGLGRENNIPMEQTVVSGNARSSTPTRRPNNITRNEVSQTVMYNRKLNLIISNIPENLIGGTKLE